MSKAVSTSPHFPVVPKTESTSAAESIYEHPSLRSRYVRSDTDGLDNATLLLGGLSCAGCALSVERALAGAAGVDHGEVNFVSHRLAVRWRPERTSLTTIIELIQSLGYEARPYEPDKLETQLIAEHRQHLRRLGVAGALGMQVMMITIALYAGHWSGIDESIRRLFESVSLVLTALVLLYSARTIFQGAWRDLSLRKLGMDVPVSIGLLLAYLASVYSTLTATGDSYYESVVMFVFLLLLARYLQFLARRRSLLVQETVAESVPVSASLIGEPGAEIRTVPADLLRPGDRVLVRRGETVPADGLVADGVTHVDESILSGESRPLKRQLGETIFGGSINLDAAIEIEVIAPTRQGRLAELVRLIDSGSQTKPRVIAMADYLAQWFVLGVLLLAGAVAVYWWMNDPQQWLAITVSVLVITCPCALSLAAPTALTAAMGALAKQGTIVTNARALELLAEANRLVFDKTGTLTQGELTLVETYCANGFSTETCQQIARALESHSTHPIARAIESLNVGKPLQVTRCVLDPTGRGLSGTVDGNQYFLGSAQFVAEQTGADTTGPLVSQAGDSNTLAVLARSDGRLLCVFEFSDTLRTGAFELIASLKARDKRLSILSGDRQSVVTEVASRLGLESAVGDLSPEDKQDQVAQMEMHGETVAMIGDGLNDAPVIASASVSIAMGAGSAMTLANADVLLMSNKLEQLQHALTVATKTRAVIRQNFTWALGYNLVAVPFAASGAVEPWLAALGMSLSSLIVVCNSIRLGRQKRVIIKEDVFDEPAMVTTKWK